MKQLFKQLKKEIIKQYGKKCTSFYVSCCVCMAWRAYEDLLDLFED